METDAILHTALFSGLLGFVAFCASYAFHVWRSRNASSKCAGRSVGSWWPRWSAGLVVLGCVVLLASAIWREVRPREGVICGHGLYTVRAEDDLRVEYVTPAQTVAAGDVLARLGSPERRAEIAELELKTQILQTQRKIIELQPMAPDGELVRRYSQCVADQRQLLASLSYLIPEHALVVREKLRDQLDKTERLNALNTRVDSTRRELEQAQAQLTLAEKHTVRMQGLSADHAAAQVELDEHATELAVARAEVTKLQTALADLETERQHLQGSLPLFATCTQQQAEEIEHEMVRVREQLAATTTDLQASQERLDADRRRAEALVTQLLTQLDLEVRQYQAKLDGLHNRLAIKAPFKGVVAYADSAPGMALPSAPVVVLTPEQGFRFRLRMMESEARSLAQAGDVTLALAAPVLQRRFPGKLAKWEPLAHEPGYVLAELVCMPPPETIREMAAHDWGTRDWLQAPTMQVRLLWRPPVHTLPMFFLAVGMIAVGGVGLGVAWLWARMRRNRRLTQHAELPGHEVSPSVAPQGLPPELATPAPAAGLGLDATAVASGATGRSLRILGQRLRESIRRQQFEPPLLQAVEWAIDRHHTRAIEHLAAGLDHDPDLPASLQALLDRCEYSDDSAPGEPVVQPDLAERLVRILRTVAPELLSPPEAPAETEPGAELAEAAPRSTSTSRPRTREFNSACR